MIPFFPIDETNIHLPVPSELFTLSSRHSTNSSSSSRALFFQVFDQESDRKLESIRKNIGDDLFAQLDESQKQFLSDVVGTVSLEGAKPSHFRKKN